MKILMVEGIEVHRRQQIKVLQDLDHTVDNYLPANYGDSKGITSFTSPQQLCSILLNENYDIAILDKETFEHGFGRDTIQSGIKEMVDCRYQGEIIVTNSRMFSLEKQFGKRIRCIGKVYWPEDLSTLMESL